MQGGRVANELLARAREISIEQAAQQGCKELLLSGKIHIRNQASQNMVIRAGWEPIGAPTNDYQLWATLVPMTSIDSR